MKMKTMPRMAMRCLYPASGRPWLILHVLVKVQLQRNRTLSTQLRAQWGQRGVLSGSQKQRQDWRNRNHELLGTAARAASLNQASEGAPAPLQSESLWLWCLTASAKMDQLPPRSCLHRKAPGIRKQSDEKDTVLPPQAHIPCCDQSKGCSASCLLVFRVQRLDTALLILPRARQCLCHLARQQEQQRQQECGLLSTLPSKSQAKVSDFPNLNQIQKPAWKAVSEACVLSSHL